MASILAQAEYVDSVQSANTLFHFMTRIDYLKEILSKKIIAPRYCTENLEYLEINDGETLFPKIAVLQKCFCDIPLHKLTESFELEGVGENYDKLSPEEKKITRKNNTHPAFYGEVAIALSKKWGVLNKLQPIHYFNQYSSLAEDFKKTLSETISIDDIPEAISNDIFNRLSFIKPLYGKMGREVVTDKGNRVVVDFLKNFHDEQEWRYVPDIRVLKEHQLDRIIANPEIFALNEKMKIFNRMSDRIAQEEYRSLCLNFNFDDVRYLIVPSNDERIELIKFIKNDLIKYLSVESLADEDRRKLELECFLLISKIVVLNELRKDW